MLHFNNLSITLSTSGMLRKHVLNSNSQMLEIGIMDWFFWALPPNLIMYSYNRIPKGINIEFGLEMSKLKPPLPSN